MAEISLRDVLARWGYSCRNYHWSCCLPVDDLASTKRARLVCDPNAVSHVVELLDVHAGLQPCDGLVSGVRARSRTCVQAAVEVPVDDAGARGVRPLALVPCVARALQFRGLAVPDVRICVPVRRFAELDRVAHAGGRVLRVEGAAVRNCGFCGLSRVRLTRSAVF